MFAISSVASTNILLYRSDSGGDTRWVAIVGRMTSASAVLVIGQ